MQWRSARQSRRHLELPWAGHLPSMERPDELNPVLLDFLNGTLATR
jgi:pimeloyl-ACP methyl ester carboxylesterase